MESKKGARLKVLLVAFSDSIHTARLIGHIDLSRFEVHLFPSRPFREVHSNINEEVVIHQIANIFCTDRHFVVSPFFSIYDILRKIIGRKATQRLYIKFYHSGLQKRALKRLIKSIDPLIVHTMETQYAGYQLSAILQASHKPISWIHSTWGIDLHHFQTIVGHRHRLQNLFSKVNFLITEGERDILIAQELGYRGKTLTLPSVGGGFDFDTLDQSDGKLLPSQRKKIILKGYDGGERQAGKVILALKKIKDALIGFEVIVYSCNKSLLPLISEIQQKEEFNISVQGELGYVDMLKLTASARMSITNNLSDGVPNTMLEAMAFGTFPIQSETAITDGWIEDGFNGLLTQPQQIDQIASTIKRALNDDNLVDSASEYNKRLVRYKLDSKEMRIVINNLYEEYASLNRDNSLSR